MLRGRAYDLPGLLSRPLPQKEKLRCHLTLSAEVVSGVYEYVKSGAGQREDEMRQEKTIIFQMEYYLSD